MQIIATFRLEEIGGAAAKEHSLEKAMEKMKSEWADMMFEFIPYRDNVSIKCLSNQCKINVILF